MTIGTHSAGSIVGANEWYQNRLSQEMLAAQQYNPPPDYYRAMSRYRPLVSVPEGWSDWYACGDQLH